MQLLSGRVSRRHAWLGVHPDGLTVRDAGSANGTWVRGERVVFAQLGLGEALELAGEVTVRCVGLERKAPAGRQAASRASRKKS